jgi:hypothetical protein
MPSKRTTIRVAQARDRRNVRGGTATRGIDDPFMPMQRTKRPGGVKIMIGQPKDAGA